MAVGTFTLIYGSILAVGGSGLGYVNMISGSLCFAVGLWAYYRTHG